MQTLRRLTTGTVAVDCKPGPSTVLTKEEEDCLNVYLIQMTEIGFGLSREDVMQMAYNIVDRSGQTHPFKDEKVGGCGLRRLGHDITDSLFAHHNHCHTAKLFALLRRPSMILWKARRSVW